MKKGILSMLALSAAVALILMLVPLGDGPSEVEAAQLLCPCDATCNQIVGTHGPDNLVGTNGCDCINGLGGDDVISGLGGDDNLCGGPGFDRIDGGAGTDHCIGGEVLANCE